MADVEGVNIRITGDSSQAVREFSKLKEAAAKIKDIEMKPLKLDWEIQHPNIDFSKLKIPNNLGRNITQGINDGIAQATTSLNDFGTRLQTTFGGVFRQIRNGLMAIVGTSGLIGMQLRKSLAIGGGFEAQMTSVKVISGSTAEELEILTKKAREMGATLPITAKNAAEAMTIMAQRGTQFADILASVEDVTELSISQGVDMATASDLLGSTMQNFGIAVEDTFKVVNYFNNASNQSALNISKLVEAMKYVGPAAGAAGMELTEATAALEVLANAGLPGEMAGTGLAMVLSKMAKNARIMGVETKDLEGKMRPLKEIFTELQEKGFSLADATRVFGERGAKAALNLAKFSGSLEQNEMRLSQLGATSKAVEEKMKSWPNVWNAFQSATEELHIEIFEQIKEKTKGAVSTIAELTRKFSEWINKTEIAKKALDAFLHGLGFNLPSTDEFTNFLDNLKIDDFLSVAQNLGKTLRNIGESIVTFFTTVKTPLLFLIENLGTFATISFWGWILGSGMRIASIALQMANGIGRLTTVLTGLAGAGAALASLTGAGLGVLAGGGIMYAIHRYSEHTIEQQKLEAEKKKAEAEMKRADEELRATIDFKTGFEDLPEAYKKASGELKAEIKEDIFYLQESFKDTIAQIYSDVQNEDFKKVLSLDFSPEEIEKNFTPIKLMAADISDEFASSISKALQGDYKTFEGLDKSGKEIVARLHDMGIQAGNASTKINELVKNYKKLQEEENNKKTINKFSQFNEDIVKSINQLIEDIPKNISDAQKYLSGNKLDFVLNLELGNAQKSLEGFIKSASEQYNISESIVGEQVFTRLKELAAQGNTTAQSLANGWKDATRDLDEFSQKAHDYVEYLGVAPEKFTPAIEKMAKGIQKIDPLTGKVTEQFKKAHAALKEWANVTFDKVAQRIQKLRKAVEGGFLKKESLEAEYKKVSSQVKAQIIMELDPLKKSLSESQYHAVLASEYQSRMTDLGGESFTEMMRKEFGKISGEAMGAMIERTAKQFANGKIYTGEGTLSYAQKVRVNGVEQTQGSQGFNMQTFTQALSPITSNLQQLASQKQSSPVIDYSSNIAAIIAELKNTSVNIQNVKVAVDNMNTNRACTINCVRDKNTGG